MLAKPQVMAYSRASQLGPWNTTGSSQCGEFRLQHFLGDKLGSSWDQRMAPLRRFPEPLQLFVDGACQLPTEPSIRLASWGIVVADLSDGFFCSHQCRHPAWSLPYLFFEHKLPRPVVNCDKTMMLRTDNQLVYDRITGGVMGGVKSQVPWPRTKTCGKSLVCSEACQGKKTFAA